MAHQHAVFCVGRLRGVRRVNIFLASFLVVGLLLLAGCDASRSADSPGEAWLRALRSEVLPTIAVDGETLSLLPQSLPDDPGRVLAAQLVLGGPPDGPQLSGVARPEVVGGLYSIPPLDQVTASWLVWRVEPTALSGAVLAKLNARRTVLWTRARGGDASAASAIRKLEQIVGPIEVTLGEAPQLCQALRRALEGEDILRMAELLRLHAEYDGTCRSEMVANASQAIIAADESDVVASPYWSGTLWAIASMNAVMSLDQTKVQDMCASRVDAANRGVFRAEISVYDLVACAEVARVSRSFAPLPSHIRRFLETEIATRGRLPDAFNTDAVGRYYQVASLRMLGFDDEVIDRVAAWSTGAVDGIDKILISWIEGKPRRVPINGEGSAIERGRELDYEFLARNILLTGDCSRPSGRRLFDALPLARVSYQDLATEILVLRAALRCGEIAESSFERSLHEVVDQKLPAVRSLWDAVYATEVACARGEEIEPRTLMGLLPEPDLGSPHFPRFPDELFAAATLALVADRGCEALADPVRG